MEKHEEEVDKLIKRRDEDQRKSERNKKSEPAVIEMQQKSNWVGQQNSHPRDPNDGPNWVGTENFQSPLHVLKQQAKNDKDNNNLKPKRGSVILKEKRSPESMVVNKVYTKK